MSDPFSAATGIVSVVGFAGQVAQGIDYLHRVFNDIKNAPESVRKLQSSLKLLESTLQEASEVIVPPGKERFVHDAYQQCNDEVTALGALVKKFEPAIGDGKVKKRMKGLRAGLKTAEFQKRCDGIERAKATLEIVLALSHMQVTRDLHLIQINDTQKLNAKIDDLATCVRSFSGTTFVSSTSLKISGTFGAGVAQHPQDENEVEESKVFEDDDYEKGEIFEEALEYLGEGLEQFDSTKTLGCPVPSSASSQVAERPEIMQISSRYNVTRTVGDIWFGLGRIRWSTTRSVKHSPNQDYGQTSSHTTYTLFPSPLIYSRGVQVIWKWKSVYGRMASPWATLRLVNRIAADAPIIEAVRRGHLAKVIELISNGQASAYDVDESGKNLLEHAIFADTKSSNPAPTTDLVFILVKYLIDCGAEGGRAMRAIYLQQCALRQQSLLEGPGPSCYHPLQVKKSWKILEDITRVCLDKAIEDPYEENKLRLDLWSSSEAGPGAAPIPSFYIYHDNWSIDIQGLALEEPAAVFRLLLTVELYNPTSDHELITRLNLRYSILTSLYDADIPQKAFRLKNSRNVRSFSSRAQISGGHCKIADRHLLHALFAKCNLLRCDEKYRDTVRQHIQRTIVLLLKNGEDPHLRCPCAALWNGNEGELRTPTDLAVGRNLLDTWKEALAEAGYDAEEFVEDRVVSLPIERCLGVWCQTTFPGTKKKWNLSPEIQRKFLKNFSYLH